MASRLSNFVLAVVVVSAVACRTQVEHTVNPKPNVEIDTALTRIPQFADVPVPSGFRIARNDFTGFAAEAGSFRSGRQTYIGDGSLLELVGYFQERLPHHGWTLSERENSANATVLTYRKNDTTLKVDIHPSENRDEWEVVVRLSTSRS